MFEPRTVKTLTALFFAMTGGALVLMLMDVEPIQPPGTHLTAVAANEDAQLPVISQTDVPLRKWRSIVVHTSAEGRAVVANCHFVVDDGSAGGEAGALGVSSTAHWAQQRASAHVPGRGSDWNTESIGVCLMGEFSRRRPSDVQWQALMKLVTDLQQQFGIPSSRVYLYRDIGGRGDSPGRAFPAAEFNEQLLR